MEQIFRDYLFQKHVLVREDGGREEHVLETLFALANLFGVRITEGKDLAQSGMIAYVSRQLGEDVPKPFYQGFPESVRRLSPDQLLFDQLVHYAITYGFGHFDQAGHSLFEDSFERLAFREDCEIKDFSILTEEAAVEKLKESAANLLEGTRPLNDVQFDVICQLVRSCDYQVERCASKNTAVRLLVTLRDRRFARFLVLPDLIKVVEEIHYRDYGSEDVRKLNLRNQDRKFVTALLDDFLARGKDYVPDCHEKKAVWCGLLHHIHYRPKNETGRQFVEAMRGKENQSVYAQFERAMARKDVREAVDQLKSGKGAGAVLRNLNYIVSRMEREEDLTYVLDNLDTKNGILLMQLLLRYAHHEDIEHLSGRTFKFTKFNQMKIHAETEEEVNRRKSLITREETEAIRVFAQTKLKSLLKNQLGKVYVDPAMKNMALPIQENTAQGGFGVLAKGSRLRIPEGKKIRAFTYWEKVNDIDLSVFGIDEEGRQTEFSWRTMAGRQSAALTYSGDETSGYKGGSEYFDVDVEEFRRIYPGIKYLVFCDNVFSGVPFDKCFCKAGYMLRDVEDSGEVYEPKTVQTSFLINCNSTFAYLFGIDLETNDFLWLNVSRSGDVTVAGTTDLRFLLDYFHVTEVLNVYSFFEMMATELVEDPAEAEVIVSDAYMPDQKASLDSDSPDQEESSVSDSPKVPEIIRSYDFERILALMNGGK